MVYKLTGSRNVLGKQVYLKEWRYIRHRRDIGWWQAVDLQHWDLV